MNRMMMAGLVVLVACGKDPITSPPPVPQLAFVAGDNQTDTVGHTVPIQLGAQLTNAADGGAPIAGRILNWVVVEGNGQVGVLVSQTGVDGIAYNTFTLGTNATSGQRVVAKYLDPDTREIVTLDTAVAIAVAGPATTMRIRGPSGVQGHTFDVALSYRDQFGNRTWSCGGAVDANVIRWSVLNYGQNTVTANAVTAISDTLRSQHFTVAGQENAQFTISPDSACGVAIPSTPDSVLVSFDPALP